MPERRGHRIHLTRGSEGKSEGKKEREDGGNGAVYLRRGGGGDGRGKMKRGKREVGETVKGKEGSEGNSKRKRGKWRVEREGR